MKWINVKAVAWALETDMVHSKAERAVLVSLAAPADERGYTWPGKGSMASTWFMHHETVAGVIKALLVRRVILPTKQRRGDTKQVEVYRLPKCARSSNERCLETEPFKNGKGSGKLRKRFGKGVSNPTGTRNKEERTTNNSENRAEGNALPSLGSGPLAGPLNSFLLSLSSPKEAKPEPSWFDEIRAMYPGTTIDEDLRRIEIWAEKNNKPFTRGLTLNSLKRHPPRKPGQRNGYLYHNKFINHKEANKLALENREFLMNAKPAIKYADGRVVSQIQPVVHSNINRLKRNMDIDPTVPTKTCRECGKDFQAHQLQQEKTKRNGTAQERLQ